MKDSNINSDNVYHNSVTSDQIDLRKMSFVSAVKTYS